MLCVCRGWSSSRGWPWLVLCVGHRCSHLLIPPRCPAMSLSFIHPTGLESVALQKLLLFPSPWRCWRAAFSAGCFPREFLQGFKSHTADQRWQLHPDGCSAVPSTAPAAAGGWEQDTIQPGCHEVSLHPWAAALLFYLCCQSFRGFYSTLTRNNCWQGEEIHRNGAGENCCCSNIPARLQS